MPRNRNSRVPNAISAAMVGRPVDFIGAKTLDDVSDESRRRFDAGEWTRLVDATDAVSLWATRRLASSLTFSKKHWDQIAPEGDDMSFEFAMTMARIIGPAIGHGAHWRRNIKEIDKLEARRVEYANGLLALISADRGLDVDLSDVLRAGNWPDLNAHFHHKWSVGQMKSLEIRDQLMSGGELPEDALPKILAPLLKLEKEPRLSHFLRVFLENRNLASINSREIAAFGVYPRQKKALKRVVLVSFGNELLRLNGASPKEAIAPMLVEVSNAWFDAAPDAKEISEWLKVSRKKAEAGGKGDWDLDDIEAWLETQPDCDPDI